MGAARCSHVTVSSNVHHLHVFLVIHSCQPLSTSILQRQHAVKLQDAVKVQQQTINVQTCIMQGPLRQSPGPDSWKARGSITAMLVLVKFG